jgi:hypothetical protein
LKGTIRGDSRFQGKDVGRKDVGEKRMKEMRGGRRCTAVNCTTFRRTYCVPELEESWTEERWIEQNPGNSFDFFFREVKLFFNSAAGSYCRIRVLSSSISCIVVSGLRRGVQKI